MSERMEAAALALDAYEQHLFGDLANGHRTDHAEAEGLLHALVVDLINYGERNHLDVVDLLDALVQARIDRGGTITNPRYSFRLNTEVQFPGWRRSSPAPAESPTPLWMPKTPSPSSSRACPGISPIPTPTRWQT